jgi:hypothetical protein
VDTIKEAKTFTDVCADRGEWKGGASLLMRDQPVRFAKDTILAALDCLDTWTDQAIYVQVILHKPPISQGPTQT